MTDDTQLQVRAEGGDSPLTRISTARLGLIGRGRKDAAVLTASLEVESGEPRSSCHLSVSFGDDPVAGRSPRQRHGEILKDAENGDPKAQNLKASGYLWGPGKDLAEAARWYRKAADQSLGEAQFNLGVMYDKGEGVPQDYAQAAEWYRKAADQSLGEAQFNLGVMYDKGEGVPQDYAEAVKWYREAADQGLGRAQFNLGVMHDKGKGVTQDHAEAAKWYRKAADQGLHKAEFNLGLKYTHGQGVAQDYVQAYKWMNLATCDADADVREKCAAMRDRAASRLSPTQTVEAQRLVFEFIREWGDPDFQFDYTEAVRWWRIAAERGNADAQCNLGHAYAFGDGVAQDYGEAVYWWRKAAEQGDAGAQFHLGDMCAHGQGAPRDWSEAARWFRFAAERSHPFAEYYLGYMYANGQGVPQDYTEAARWYRRAADPGQDRARFNPICTQAAFWLPEEVYEGRTDAQNSLGVAYYYGRGVTQDCVEAVRWFRKAAEQRHAAAQNNLGVAYYYGQGVTQEYVEAVRWFRKAAEQGHTAAQHNLGVAYRDGQGITQDYVLAHMWMNLSASVSAQGDQQVRTADRDAVAAMMTTEQIGEAQRLTRAWKPKLPT